jgi:hypothetical protein
MKDIDDLFAQTMAGHYYDDQPKLAVHELQRLATNDVFNRAKEWTQSLDPMMRARGCDVLAQFGVVKGQKHPCPDRAGAIILSALKNENEPRPLMSAITALELLEQSDAVSAIVKFSNHADSAVRVCVASALGYLEQSHESILCLLRLMTDVDGDVRDWAVFGLGNLGNADNQEIREAFVAGMHDEHADVQLESILALAKRRDERVLSMLVSRLKQDDPPAALKRAAYQFLPYDETMANRSAADLAQALQVQYQL